MVLITAGFLLVRGGHKPFHKWVLYLSFGLALVAGITTLSSTFLLGLVVAVGFLVVFFYPRYQRRFLWIAIRSACVIGLLILFFLQQPLFSGGLRYQLQRILSANVLKTRYDPEVGTLANTYKAIAQRPILGWGLYQLEGVFVGDPLYVSTLYRGGILGLLLFLWVVWTILRHTWRFSRVAGTYGKINTLCFLWTLLSLVTSVRAGGGFLALRLQEWYWAVVGISLNAYLARAQSSSKEVN